MLILCTRWYVLLTTDFITSTGVQLRAPMLAQGSSRPCRHIKDTFTVNVCSAHTCLKIGFFFTSIPALPESACQRTAVCSGIVVPAKWAKLHRSACQGSEKLIKVLHSPNLMSFIFLMWMGWLTHKILALNFSGKIMEEGPSQAFPPNCMLGGKLPSCCIIRKEHQFLNKLHRNGRDLVTCTWEWVCYSKKHPDSVNHFRVTHLKQLL